MKRWARLFESRVLSGLKLAMMVWSAVVFYYFNHVG